MSKKSDEELEQELERAKYELYLARMYPELGSTNCANYRQMQQEWVDRVRLEIEQRKQERQA